MKRPEWVPETQSWVLTCADAGRFGGLVHRILNRVVVAMARSQSTRAARRTLEIVVLRHQLGVLRRQLDRPELAYNEQSRLGAIATNGNLEMPVTDEWISTVWWRPSLRIALRRSATSQPYDLRIR